jgi:hypothetical protein
MIDVIVALVILGLILWVVDQIPIDATIKRIIHVIAIVIAVLWCLQVFGLWHGFPAFRR